MKVQIHEDFTAAPLEDSSTIGARRWGVLDSDQCTGVIVESSRSYRRGSGHHLTAHPSGLYTAEAGTMNFQRGLYVPLGRSVMRASVNVAEVSLTDVPLGDLSEGEHVEYYEVRSGSDCGRIKSRPKLSLAGGHEAGQPENDLELLERGIVTAIGARFVGLTADLEAYGEKCAIPQMIPRFEPIGSGL